MDINVISYICLIVGAGIGFGISVYELCKLIRKGYEKEN